MELLRFYNVLKIDYNSEIWLKSQRVKIKMLKVLIKNIRSMLNNANIPFTKYQLSDDSARIFFFFKNEHLSAAIEVLKNVFGIQTMSPALRTSNNLGHITSKCLEIAKHVLEPNDSFAIRVKRAGKQEYTSQDVANILGKAIMDEFAVQKNLSVNLTNPKKTIHVEIRNQFSYIFTDIIESNWKGLPIETHKKIMVMDVGRLEDLLAGFLMMKRGCLIHPVLFCLTKKEAIWQARMKNWKELLKYLPFLKFFLVKVDLLELLKKIHDNLQFTKYTCATCRLLRFHALAKILGEVEPSYPKEMKAISDGLTFTNHGYCSNIIDLNSLALNYNFNSLPIFTPNIGYNEDDLRDMIIKISNNLLQVEYCDLKPKNQEFNKEVVMDLYNTLQLDDSLSKLLHDIKKINLKKDIKNT
ncbi:MAG: THUMP domain-containing protein [Promethearchaeota archaeon]